MNIFHFFLIEFYRIFRNRRILYWVMLKRKITKNYVPQILQILYNPIRKNSISCLHNEKKLSFYVQVLWKQIFYFLYAVILLPVCCSWMSLLQNNLFVRFHPSKLTIIEKTKQFSSNVLMRPIIFPITFPSQSYLLIWKKIGSFAISEKTLDFFYHNKAPFTALINFSLLLISLNN